MTAQRPFASGRSLSDLGPMLDYNPGQERERLFEQNLKGKFDRISAGNFKVDLPGIESITVTPLPAKPGQKATVYATIFYRKPGGAETSTTWSIFEDGIISGNVPDGLDLSKEKVEHTILETIGKIDVNFWHKIDLDVLPFQDEKEEEKGGTGKPGGRPMTDLERLEFLKKQDQALFGFVDESKGFNGYHGAVFPTFIILEKPKTNNAAFIVDLQERVDVDPRLAKNLSDKEIKALAKKYWEPITNEVKTKKGLRSRFGAVKVVHTQSGSWRERIKEEIDRRLVS